MFFDEADVQKVDRSDKGSMSDDKSCIFSLS